MADLKIKDLLDKNNEMVKTMQQYKLMAAQRENEKLDLMRENSELRLKLAKLRSGDAAQTRKLNADLQSAGEQALSHLVHASNDVAKMLHVFKAYMQDRQEMEAALPRWSNLSNTPVTEKINRVPPLLIGGRHIQPVVSLSRTLQSSNSRPVVSRSPNQNNRSISGGAVPMHMLQDLFIPLTRIDAERPNMRMDVDANIDGGNEDLASEDGSERNGDDSHNMSDSEDFEESPRLEALQEDVEPSEDQETSHRSVAQDPLEGPSWLLEESNVTLNSNNLTNLEPDSTTELHENVSSVPTPGPSGNDTQESEEPLSVAMRCEFTPTVRRRKRSTLPPPTSPHFSPRPARRNSNSRRILKVMVAKMRLDGEDGGNVSPPKRPTLDEITPKAQKIFHRRALESPKHQESVTTRHQSVDGSPMCLNRDMSPSKRLMRFDAPSPNGSTDSRVIVLETNNGQPEPCCSGVSTARTETHTNQPNSNPTTHNQRTSSDYTSDSRSCRPDSRNNRPKSRNRSRDVLSSNGLEGRDSDSSSSDVIGEGRTRRPRKAVVYKERPLNRKLRR